ncbi:DUF4430 domain-containing protein [Streptococcus suis]|uniref:DUF4430 domain-containing protein n=1 Tax=Streptococcus suis TaxID=1307 RepID=UPI0004270910|nr:DUF4430 domain-containing protein [Streptococcus suis]MCB2861571.1 DUF4430 domain-containing protein [Streptococcus suis]MCB2869990.1 DUF4430 domain-containing protein [Streptococcus suis]MCK4023829.1 DUF4430 domain-containing protein [Streptococcus suis]MDW8725970.1 DUF4430 domain-containing protein [Streptococcus suis]NQH63912.1 DUF4430 domain-containing protein [Streptococcus suis]
MKKISIMLTVVFSLFLAACTNTTEKQNNSAIEVTLQITTKDKENRQEVTAEEGDSVMDVLKEHHDIVEDNGLITEIDGVSQDTSTNTYWMYKVNGQMADKGAKDLTVANGDEIEFYLETFE